MDAALRQPPLSKFQIGWRYAIALALGALAWSDIAIYQFNDNRRWLVTDLSLGVMSFIIVAWRRRFPVPVALATAILSGVSFTASGASTLALMSLSTRRRWVEIVPVVIATVGAAGAQIYVGPARESWMFVFPFSLAIIGVTVGWGLYIGSRRELIATLEERANRAETEQSLRVSQARTAERARIAREMHDVLAHRISMVTMHAGALAYRDDLEPDQIRETSALIQQSSHLALEELREVLGVLRDETDDSASDRPQPAAADIAELVAQARASGLVVRINERFDLATLPVALGRGLYRIVQEALTNARKHARGAVVDVHFDGRPGDGLMFEISNPLSFLAEPAPESGYGLIGLAERAELLGGRLTHSIRKDGRFVVEGWLPWPN